uniref:CWH43-like N-terminal domain-containing protein n=1 Tax=Amphiprion ocellaris TaxID=80972 RepID=A0A3Q1AK03_AMPOC
MSLWMILPVSLPVLTITGIWVVYAMALYNQHVCPVDNWLYNQSCEEELYLQSGPSLCCTLDNVPLISKCGTLPPESCFFSLICSTGSFMVMVIVLLRYAHVIEKHQNCVLNTASLSTGWICAAGLIMVGNFQASALQNWEEFYGKSQGEVSHQVWPCMERSWADWVCAAEAPSLTNHEHDPCRPFADCPFLYSGTFQWDAKRDDTDSE